MKILYGNQLIDFVLVEPHGLGHIKLRYGHGLDQSGASTYFDSLILRAGEFEVLEASQSELEILERAMREVKPMPKPRPKPEVKFWKVEFNPPKLLKGARKIGYDVLFRDPFTGHESKAELMKGGGKGFLYVKCPYPPRALFIKFKLKNKEFKRFIPFRFRWIEVIE